MSIIVERLDNAIMRGDISTPAWVVNTMRDARTHIALLEARNDTLERIGTASERYFLDITAACRPELEIALLAGGYLKEDKP